MNDKRTPKNYRLSARTLKQIAWVAERTNRNATDVIETAVAEYAEKTRKAQRAHLVPTNDRKGWYDLVIDGLPVLTVEHSALSKMGAHAQELLSPEGGEENLFGLVTLAAAMSGKGMTVYKKNIKTVMGPFVDEAEKAL